MLEDTYENRLRFMRDPSEAVRLIIALEAKLAKLQLDAERYSWHELSHHLAPHGV